MVELVVIAGREGTAVTMPVRRDPRTGGWFFRTTVKTPDGKKLRLYGTPGVPGPYHDLAATKIGAQAAEQRAISGALHGKPSAPVAPAAPKEVPTIREYSEKFLATYKPGSKPSTKLDKRHRLNAYILPALGDVRLDALRQEDVDQLVARQLRRGLGRKTVNNITAVLSSMLKYAVRNKVSGPVDLSFTIKVQGTELFAVAPDDVDKLAATADARYCAAILLAADAGLRVGEIRALRWCEVNEPAREISISRSYDRTGELTETKGWERRVVPITDRLWSALKKLDRVGPLVIARLDGGALGYDAAREALREIYVRAEVEPPPMPWHALRHSFGTDLANSGVPVHVIRVLMGHKSIETTLRYMHTDRSAKRDAIAALRGSRGSHAAAKAGSKT